MGKVSVAPVPLGAGVRLLDGVGPVALERCARVHTGASMTEVAAHVVLPALTAHLVEALSSLLPAGLSLVHTGVQVALLAGTSPPRTVSTHTPTAPETITENDVPLRAEDLLADLQDLVVSHLHTPWPITPGGRTTYTAVAVDGGHIRLSFVSKDGSERIDLPDFVPPGPGRTVLAG